jgi:hypothetical protein
LRSSHLETTSRRDTHVQKILLAFATLVATMGFAFAQVDVNKADQAALDSVKGIGPVTRKPSSTSVPRVAPSRIGRISKAA